MSKDPKPSKAQPNEDLADAPSDAISEPVPAIPAAEAARIVAEPAREYFGELLKLKAEFENYRKRVDRERPEWFQSGRAATLEKLLPLYDVLLQAREQVAKAGEKGASKDIVKGLELIFKEFSKAFESEGVTAMETVGKPYHYDLHEAMGYVETDAHPDGTVVEELQRGFMLKGKVLRPARVRIAKAKDERAASA